jgi:hypothetical protein
MIGRIKAGGLVLAVAGSALLAGCSLQVEASPDQPLTKPSPSASSSPEIALTSSDLTACSVDPTRSRVGEALYETTISPGNSSLALPQEMATYAKAAAQMKARKALAEPDRLFQICLNYQQGNFGSHTPEP